MFTFFIHIPKTGGQTLQRWLEDLYGPERILVWNPAVTWVMQRNRDELRSLLERNPTVEAVAGHFPYGMHEVLADRPHRYVTFLRDPVDRWISERVHHLTKNADEHLLRSSFAECYGDIDLFRLLRSTITDDDDMNLQSRFIRHAPDGCRQGGDPDGAGVMARFWFVGRQESLAADCRRLARLLGRGELPLRESRNVAAVGDVRSALSADEIAWIADRNRDDIALCRHVPASDTVRPGSPPADRREIVAAILHGALARMAECFLALKQDRDRAQVIMDHLATVARVPPPVATPLAGDAPPSPVAA